MKRARKVLGKEDPKAEAARKVVTGHRERKTGIVNNHMLGWPVQHDSILEKAFLKRTVLCPGVKRVWWQHFRIDGHIPDFDVELSNGRIVVEVKFSGKVHKYIAAFNKISAKLAERGIPFYVLTEEQVRADYKDEHAEEVLRYGKAHVSLEERARVLAAVEAAEGITAADLQKTASVDMQVILHMVATRLIASKPTMVPDERSRIFLVREPTNCVAAFEAHFGVKPWQRQPEIEGPKPKKKRTLKRRASRIGPVLRTDASYESGKTSIAGGIRSL